MKIEFHILQESTFLIHTIMSSQTYHRGSKACKSNSLIEFQASNKWGVTPSVYKFIIPAFLFSVLVICGCEVDPIRITPDQIEEGSWMTYSPIRWTHDGDPYYSDYCIVYSDGAEYGLKQDIGQFADMKFSEIVHLFNFNELTDFRYPPGYNKIDVYINMFHEENIAAAYWGSIFITLRSAHVDLNRYDYLFKHELTHAFEFLIEGTVNLGTDVWFKEGIAIYCGGGLNGITDVNDLENWISRNAEVPGLGNPIRIHVWEDFPPDADITAYYYTVFDLTMRYFLDPDGLGKSTEDVLKLFYDIRNGMLFKDAFQNNFDISMARLEIDYYDRMRSYLGQMALNEWERKIDHTNGIRTKIP